MSNDTTPVTRGTEQLEALRDAAATLQANAHSGCEETAAATLKRACCGALASLQAQEPAALALPQEGPRGPFGTPPGARCACGAVGPHDCKGGVDQPPAAPASPAARGCVFVCAKCRPVDEQADTRSHAGACARWDHACTCGQPYSHPCHAKPVEQVEGQDAKAPQASASSHPEAGIEARSGGQGVAPLQDGTNRVGPREATQGANAAVAGSSTEPTPETPASKTDTGVSGLQERTCSPTPLASTTFGPTHDLCSTCGGSGRVPGQSDGEQGDPVVSEKDHVFRTPPASPPVPAGALPELATVAQARWAYFTNKSSINLMAIGEGVPRSPIGAIHPLVLRTAAEAWKAEAERLAVGLLNSPGHRDDTPVAAYSRGLGHGRKEARDAAESEAAALRAELAKLREQEPVGTTSQRRALVISRVPQGISFDSDLITFRMTECSRGILRSFFEDLLGNTEGMTLYASPVASIGKAEHEAALAAARREARSKIVEWLRQRAHRAPGYNAAKPLYDAADAIEALANEGAAPGGADGKQEGTK